MNKILIVDDEPDIRTIVKYNLEKEGYFVEEAENGVEAIKTAKRFLPDLIILDVMMPGIDGIETCEKIRQEESIKNTLVAFLTARNEDYSQIAGLDSGGDDYISKPIKPKILTSRVKALLRRIDNNNSSISSDNEEKIVINRDKYVVYRNGKELILPKKEFELLALLHEKPGKVFTRQEILDMIWGKDVVVGDRTIDVHVRKLREKLGNSDYIKTIKGVGYRFDPDVE